MCPWLVHKSLAGTPDVSESSPSSNVSSPSSSVSSHSSSVSSHSSSVSSHPSWASFEDEVDQMFAETPKSYVTSRKLVCHVKCLSFTCAEDEVGFFVICWI